MEEKQRLPEGVLLARGEILGRSCRERLIREGMGAVQLHLRFPVWEGAEGANALLEAVMGRLYAYARKKAEENTPLSVVAQYRLTEGEGELSVSLRGYVGDPRHYQVREWATLCFTWEGKCPCREVIFAKNKGKRGKEGRIC